jgi:hypothetical protein
METTERLLAAWRAAEAAVEAAEPGSTARRRARNRADLAKTAYHAHVQDVFDVEGHREADGRPSDHGSAAKPSTDRRVR